MRNLHVLALLAGLGWCCRAQAAVDCNMPEFEFVNDAYVCLSGTFKAQNNQIQDMEDKLKRPSEKIRNELAQVKKKLARETGDTPKASAARKKLEKWADELRRRVDEADRDAREKRNFIGQIKNEGRECRTERSLCKNAGRADRFFPSAGLHAAANCRRVRGLCLQYAAAGQKEHGAAAFRKTLHVPGKSSH